MKALVMVMMMRMMMMRVSWKPCSPKKTAGCPFLSFSPALAPKHTAAGRYISPAALLRLTDEEHNIYIYMNTT